MAARCATVLPPSLSLLVPPLRVVSACMWQVAQHRQVKNYTKVEEFVSDVLEMVPLLLSTKERIELLVGLRAKVILELCRDNPSITVQMLQPHFKRLKKISESTSNERDMYQKVDAAVRNLVDLIQALVKKPGYRRRYFQDIYPLHYGQRFDTALLSLVAEFLSRVEMLLPVPSFHQVAAWFDESPSILEDFLQMVHDPKPIQVLLHHCKDVTRLSSGSSSHIMPDTILSTLSGTHCSSVQAALGTKPAEKCVSAPHDLQSSLNESDTYDDHEDWSGDVDEGDPQRDSDEGQNDTSQHDQQSDSEQSGQTPFSKKEVNGTNEFNSYRSAVERTVNNDEGKDTASTEENGVQGSFHNVPNPGITNDGAIRCTECGKAFYSESLLRKHKEAHTKEKSAAQKNETGHQPENTAAYTPRLHPCSECKKIFYSKGSLANHQTVHTGQRHHLCSHCGKTCKTKRALDAHIRTHTGERPFECSVCGKRFNYRALLILHERIHTGEKPYLCSYCGKDFTGAGALMFHTRTHTGERPFKCEFCPKTFTMSCHLAKHRRVHTREKPYSCPVCSKRFAQQEGMKRHVRIHTGEKPFECLECGKRFAVQSNMKVHQRVHRKKENLLPFSSN
ncbi:zinc finger protein 17-like [Engraulis encrasicolus]|uniref:zinc finger protein 17-like n=1 Tax=Engraulis encrasicolus TaxID=184585 RepID=UPI002FD67CA7